MALGDIFKKILGRPKEQVSITLTNITLKFGGDFHALEGRTLKEQIFSLEVPFQNKMGSGLLPDNLKGPDITINQVSAEKPFELIDISPKPPVNVAYLSSTLFKLKIKAPMANYTGPLLIAFNTESKDNVNVDLDKMVLVHGEEKAEMPGTKINMILKKSQIIRRDIQAYNILKYGQKVEGISISKPFEIVSADPAPPFTVDRKDSYVVKLFIKCPDFNYAGSMEISFK